MPLTAPRWSSLDEADRITLLRASSHRRRWLAGLVVLLLLATLASLFVGSSWIRPGAIWSALLDPTGSSDAQVVIREVRIPRTLLALLVGAAMGAAGAVMQGATRNPLADPGILGVNAGSSLMVVVAVTWLSLTVFSQFVWFSLVGAAGASVLVYLLGTRGPRGGSPVTMTLAGAAVTILLSSAAGAILLSHQDAAEVFAHWAIGSLEGVSLNTFVQVTPLILAGVLLALVSGRLINALSLGDDVAQSLGQRVRLARIVVLLSVMLTCGAGTAAVGPVGFVGFLVPHLARRITGPDYRWIVALSIPLGAVFLLLADVLGRFVLGDIVIAAGLMTSFLGGPVFIMLAQSSRLREL